MTKPDFFVIGAARAATTSVYQAFTGVPGVFLSRIKEPNYFARDLFAPEHRSCWSRMSDVNVNSYFRRNRQTVINFAVIEQAAHYAALFDQARAADRAGEMSTTYLLSDRAPDAVWQHNPDARIIAILRDPVTRLISHYSLYRRMGVTRLTLDEFLARERTSEGKPYGCRYFLVEHGMYAAQVERWQRRFGRDQLKIVLYEELVAEPARILASLLEFMGVPAPAHLELERANAGSLPRSARLSRIVTSLNLKPTLRSLLGAKVLDRLRPLYFGKAAEPTVSRDRKRELWRLYARDVAKLELGLARDLDVWKRHYE